MASTSKDHSGMPAAAMVSAQLPSSSATVPSVSAAQQAEDEARKKNTDCVYFLASPLTCKKGSECEYRHSEYARVNPRDCWFWMNGSCLNPKCSFRHPPLDNLIGSQTAGSTASSVMGSSGSSSAPSQAAPSAPFITAKQAAPCIFFQKGYCLKGDFCPFSHMLPYPTNSKPPQFSSSTGADSGFKKSFVGVEKCSQPKVHLQANASKPVDVLTASKASVNSTPALVRNGASAEHYGRKPPVAVHIELPKQKFTTSHPSINGSLRSKSGHATNHHASLLEEQIYQNGKEIDESLRESSPGFDVLVDDERGGPDYYGDEDRFPRIRDRDGRSVNEFEIGYSDDYRSTGLEMYNDLRTYDKHEEKRYARDHYRSSSERPLVESAHFDRRAGMYKGEAPDRIENVDLRQRLLKHKRGGGLRSVVSHDYAPENHHSEERHYKSSRRDSERSPQPPHHESSLGSRLQGRIRFPGKSSTGSDAKEEYDRARNRGRLSPTKPNLTSHRGRVQDRLSGRVQQDDGVRAPLRTRRDVTEDQSTNFTPPKSLAELKSSKQVQSKERVKGYVESTSLGKRKALEGSVDTEGDTSFEGPKPLSEILKKKRGVSSAVVKVPGARERSTSSSLSATADEQGGDSSFATDGVNVKQINKEENKSIVKDGRENHGLLKPDKSAGTESSKSNSKAEEKLAEDDGYEGGDVQDEEGEVAEGEYEYGQEDGEEGYNLEEGENGELAEEYMDEDDGDDFAKKIGVMFS